jgi:hypothetical protein
LGKLLDMWWTKIKVLRLYNVFDYQISPGSPSCPHHLQAHLRAYLHNPTHNPLTNLILLVLHKPAIYTCNFFLQATQSSSSHCNSFLNSIAFLAILFLLLIIAAGIVTRSYVLRRRAQRRLEDALGPGQLLAPRAQGSKIKRLGTAPKIINTWVAEGGDKWNQIMVSFIFLLIFDT